MVINLKRKQMLSSWQPLLFLLLYDICEVKGKYLVLMTTKKFVKNKKSHRYKATFISLHSLQIKAACCYIGYIQSGYGGTENSAYPSVHDHDCIRLLKTWATAFQWEMLFRNASRNWFFQLKRGIMVIMHQKCRI